MTRAQNCMPERVPPEHDEQVLFVAWLGRHDILHHAVPNAAKRSHKAAARLKAEGMQAGWPDITIDEPAAKGMGMGLAPRVFVEMKRIKGSKTSPEQKACHARLRARGHTVIVAKGAQAAIEAMTELGYGR